MPAVKIPETYQWYTFKGATTQRFQTRRGQDGSLPPGYRFGVRPSRSESGLIRLLLEESGPHIIFTLTAKQVASLLKTAKPAESPFILTPAENRLAKRLAALLKRKATDWDFITELNWPRNGSKAGYAASAHKALLVTLPPARLQKLDKVSGRYRNKLLNKVQAYEDKQGEQLFEGGDDSFGDACAQAVSMGQTRYEAFLADPALFIRTFNKRGSYHESFDYCF